MRWKTFLATPVFKGSFLLASAAGLVLLFQNCSGTGQFNSISQAGSSNQTGLGDGAAQVLSCSVNGLSYSIGQSINGFTMQSVVYPLTCGAQVKRTCLDTGKFDGPVPVYAACNQQCLDPASNQPVNAGSTYFYYTKSSGATQADCDAAKVTSTCQSSTGVFSPVPPANRFASCLVAGQTCAYTNGTGIAVPTGNAVGSTVKGYAKSSATYPQLCGSQVTATCQTSGAWTLGVPLYTTCAQKCLQPDTQQPVDAATSYVYYTISSGTQAQCDAAKVTSSCQTSTGLFAPVPPSTRYGSCAVVNDPPPISSGDGPLLLFTDAISGPISGGENNKGSYLTLYGKNFGADLSNIKVYVGALVNGQPNAATEVASYRALGKSVTYEKNQIQFVSVQVGALGNPTLGGALPVFICVSGKCSAQKADLTFTPNAGRIFFVSLTGGDTTGVIGDIGHPFRHLQNTSPSNDCTSPSGTQNDIYSKLKPGDHVVIRAGSYSDIGRGRAWLRFCASNSAIGDNTPLASGGGVYGTAGNWIHFTAYPGETVTYTTPANMSGAFQGAESAVSGYTGMYISFSNFHIAVDKNAATDAAPMNEQSGSGPWRVVNNELGPWPSVADARAGGYSGRGQGTRVFANYVHDIRRICDSVNANNATLMAQCPGGKPVIVNGESLLNHGFYLDAAAGDTEVAFNWISNIWEGNLVQTYASHGGGNLTGLKVHNNWMENAGKFGLNISDGTHSGQFWDNIVIGSNFGGLRVNVGYDSGVNIQVFNNTFYNNSRSDTCQSSTTWNAGMTGTNLMLVTNNLFVAGPDSMKGAALYCANENDGFVVFGKNLVWDPKNPGASGTSTPNKTSTTFVKDPLFNSPSTGDFTLKTGSPALRSGEVVNDLPSFLDYTMLVLKSASPGMDLGVYQSP